MRLQLLAQKSPQIAGNQSNTSKLLHLDDQCLKRICNYLELPDLCSIADTCTRLNGIAGTVFKQNSQFRQFSSDTYNDRTMPTDSMVWKLFPIFGQFITEWNIDWTQLGYANPVRKIKQDFYYRMIDCYCTNLVSFAWPIQYFPLPHIFDSLHCVRNLQIACHHRPALMVLNKMHECVKNVDHLTFHKGTMDEQFYYRLSQLNKLRTLHLMDMINEPDLLELQHVKQLSELKIRKHLTIEKEDVIDLVRALPNLNKLIFERTNLFIDEKTYLTIVGIRRQMGNKKLILHNIESLANEV